MNLQVVSLQISIIVFRKVRFLSQNYCAQNLNEQMGSFLVEVGQ